MNIAHPYPEVVICSEPGLDSEKLENYGYHTRSYFRGQMDTGPLFIGWNGKKGETKSSSEILEEALIVKNQHLNNTKFIEHAVYFDYEANTLMAKVDLRILAYPYGRCFSISPPPLQRNASDKIINRLNLKINGKVFKKYENISIGIYFMDRTNSLKIYPDEDDLLGNPLRIRLAEVSGLKSSYKTKISRSKHVEGDPNLKCKEYTSTHPYNDCIQEELHDKFDQLLGCQPPLLGKDPKSLCNERFNVSTAKAMEIARLFLRVQFHSEKFKCRTPCTKNKYTTTHLHTAPHPHTMIILVFDETVEVTSSTFSIDGWTFLSSLGGSVSSGRTVLWILVTMIGAAQVIKAYKSQPVTW